MTPKNEHTRSDVRDQSGHWVDQSVRREVEHIVEYSDRKGIPVFMKESLRELMGDDFRQEFPWEVI